MADVTKWHSCIEPKNCLHEEGNLTDGRCFILVLNAARLHVSVVANYPAENVTMSCWFV